MLIQNNAPLSAEKNQSLEPMPLNTLPSAAYVRATAKTVILSMNSIRGRTESEGYREKLTYVEP